MDGQTDLDYNGAIAECEIHGGVLASIHHHTVNAWLEDEAGMSFYGMWIGLHRTKSGRYLLGESIFNAYP